jgi:hypothetical protein
MSGAAATSAAPGAAGVRPALAIAAVGSFVAGVVHIAAAANHDGDALLGWMFALCAAAQLGWAWVVATTPYVRREVLLAGLVINGGAVLVWALTRTVGIGFVESLATVESVGIQDFAAAAFAALSVGAVLCALLRPAVTTTVPPSWTGAVAVAALVLAVPALTAEHAHEGGHDHAAGDEHAAGEHGHGEGEEHADGDHADGDHADGDHADGDHADGDHADGDHADGDHADGDHADSDHADGDHGHGAVLAAAGGHGHDDASTHDSGGEHGHPPTTDGGSHGHPPATGGGSHEHPPTTGGGGHPHPDPDAEPPITSVDDPRLTEAQFLAAVNLYLSTSSGMSGFLTVDDATAAGYVWMGDGGEPGEYGHYINWSYLTDPYELDPGHIEAIVVKTNADHTVRVVSAMYMLTSGDTLDDAPPLMGELTNWHDHANLCFEGMQRVALAVDGVCPSGTLVDLPPMLYVWVEANPCGEFGAIDEHGQDCGATHEH